MADAPCPQEGALTDAYVRYARAANLGRAEGLELVASKVRLNAEHELPLRVSLSPSITILDKSAGIQRRYHSMTIQKRMASCTRPFLLTFHEQNDEQTETSFLLKPEDVGKEACVAELKIMVNELWSKHQITVRDLPVYVKEYAILPATPDNGFVELVPECVTIDKLKRECSWLQGTLERAQRYLGDDTEKLDRLCATTAGFLAFNYMVGVADGHSDNVLLSKAGELIRIDFGYVFGETLSGIDSPVLWLPKTIINALGEERFGDAIEASKRAIEVLLVTERWRILEICGLSAFTIAFGLSARAHVESLSLGDFTDGLNWGAQLQKNLKSVLHSFGYGLAPSRPASQLEVNKFSPMALCLMRHHCGRTQVVTDPSSMELLAERLARNLRKGPVETVESLRLESMRFRWASASNRIEVPVEATLIGAQSGATDDCNEATSQLDNVSVSGSILHWLSSGLFVLSGAILIFKLCQEWRRFRSGETTRMKLVENSFAVASTQIAGRATAHACLVILSFTPLCPLASLPLVIVFAVGGSVAANWLVHQIFDLWFGTEHDQKLQKACRALGLPPSALHEDHFAFRQKVRSRYHELARRHHPDRGGIPEEFRKVNDAYGFLICAFDLEKVHRHSAGSVAASGSTKSAIDDAADEDSECEEHAEGKVASRP